MSSVFSTATLLNGLVLGWSVAWPPGPVNAEMIRRGLLPRSAHGGFWAAWFVGLGACTGDFFWALGVSAGAGALINTTAVRLILGVISLALLLFLAGVFALGAWRAARSHRATSETIDPKRRLCARYLSGNPGAGLSLRKMPGYLLGLTLALTSPWNIGFWLAVIGSQSGSITGSFTHSLFLAASVVLGAIAWGCVLSIAVHLGARIFSRPAWQVATQALTALVMLYFAARLVLQLR